MINAYRTWDYLNKDNTGQWEREPDRITFDLTVGGVRYHCAVIRNGESWALCGYVGVPVGHKFHGESYVDLNDDIVIHGGLTYSAPKLPRRGVDAAGTWFLGFDCAHSDDLVPRLWRRGTYRTVDYVLLEVLRLVDQCAGTEYDYDGKERFPAFVDELRRDRHWIWEKWNAKLPREITAS